MNNREKKIAIERMKIELSNLSFYINNITPLPKDKKSIRNLMDARMSAARLDGIIKNDMSSIEKDISNNLEKESSEKFRDRLASINNPNSIMKKTADDFLSSRPLLVKKAISEQIKKANLNDKQKGSMGIR